VHRVITATGLDVEMAASPDMLRLHRSEGLASFVELVAGFADAEGDAGIGAFLVWLRLASRFDKVPELDRPSTPGSVQLMTVHRSKGLEWPVVVIPSLTATVFPDSKGMTRWTSQSKAVPFPERGDADSLPQLRGFTAKDHKAFADACRDHSTLDETRLAYVAVTRAERLVIASSSWWGPSQARKRGPSPFLQTLREQCLVGAGTVDVWTAPPDDDAVNPSLGDTVDLPWPPARDSGALERLRTAATGVLDHAGLTVDDLRAEHARPAADSAAGAEGSPLLGLDAEDLELVRGWDDDIALLLEERRAERSATRTVPLPASLSASDLVRLAADPDTFTRRLARPVPSAPAPSARRGTRFHAWVEAHFGVQPLLEPDDLPGSSDPDIGSDEAFEAMQQRFLALPYADRTPLGIEVAFSLVIAGRVVPGRIDAVFAETRPDGSTHYEVLDWKTSRRHDADPLQLAIYRVAFAEQTGVPLEDVTAAFVYLHDGVVVPYADLPDRAGLEALLLGARGPGTGVADREPVAGPEASAATTH
jgi:DNA helicase-2/ATP-dependent DNA helicase PcrA